MHAPTVDYLLTRIADNQAINSPFFINGLLPAYRYNAAWAYHRPDQNLFFTAISLFTLQRLIPLLTTAEQTILDPIMARALPAYDRFRNKDGLATYNFYATNPSAHFPHGWLMHRFRHFQLPDDIDDTAMVYLTRSGGPSQPAASDLDFLSKKLARHANRTSLTVQNTFPEYRQLRAYSTWFGLHMPIEFDACAMTNMLYAVYEYGLPLDVHAQDSLAFLADIVQTDRYRTDPFRCAHNYARTPLIAYHLARLIGRFDPEPLQAIRQKFIADLNADFSRTTSRPDQLLIAIALMRLGQMPPIDVPMDTIEADFAPFSFFIAGLLSAYTQPWLYRWANRPFWHIRWQCDDHNRVLLLEYLVLKRQLAAKPVRSVVTD
ncbi:hypothetical protein [uncultured Fibrella sp.]|uniref:hypothetical protein n=1 Tax=uncultured Fibrella sp. TaxID=1284596 RepID=UPI0035CA744E